MSEDREQRDTDDDGFGNRCDTDLNNDGITNILDLGLLKAVLDTDDADADIDGDGTVGTSDLDIMQTFFTAARPISTDHVADGGR